MDEVQERWRPGATQGSVTLLVSYDGDPEAVVLADRGRLLQLFDGLIGEAMSGSTRGAVEASVRATHGTDGVVLEGRVRGANKAELESRDLDARIRDIDSGLGLEIAVGALLAGGIVKGMGGQIRREANAGTSETVTFELALDVPPDAPEAPAPTSRTAHVLVVDDNATNRMVAQSLVEMFKCTSETAEDGLEAVESARSGRFDLILMDIRMPNMDGVDATRAIRAMPGAIGATPIIALTYNAGP